MGEIYADIGRKDKALENLKTAESMFKEMDMNHSNYWIIKTQEAIGRL